jgi:hypothetical protein
VKEEKSSTKGREKSAMLEKGGRFRISHQIRRAAGLLSSGGVIVRRDKNGILIEAAVHSLLLQQHQYPVRNVSQSWVELFAMISPDCLISHIYRLFLHNGDRHQLVQQMQSGAGVMVLKLLPPLYDMWLPKMVFGHSELWSSTQILLTSGQ